MLEKIAAGLFVAMIAGLSSLAFLNAATYRVIAVWVCFLATQMTFGMFCWSVGAESRTDFSLPDAKNPMMRAVIVLGCWFALMSYMAFLYFIPYLSLSIGNK